MAEDGQRGLLFKEIFIINKPAKSLNNFKDKIDEETLSVKASPHKHKHNTNTQLI